MEAGDGQYHEMESAKYSLCAQVCVRFNKTRPLSRSDMLVPSYVDTNINMLFVEIISTIKG